VDEDLRAMRTELTGRIDAQAARTDALSARIDALQRTMIQVGGGMIATLVAGFAALVAAHLA
jgi:CHASE3 domain sensor protein